MCLDINKYIDIVSTNELDNIDNITRKINSYDINELITYSEFLFDDDEISFTYEKCETDCFDEVNSMFHAFQRFMHFIMNIRVNLSNFKASHITKSIFKSTKRFFYGRIFNSTMLFLILSMGLAD